LCHLPPLAVDCAHGEALPRLPWSWTPAQHLQASADLCSAHASGVVGRVRIAVERTHWRGPRRSISASPNGCDQLAGRRGFGFGMLNSATQPSTCSVVLTPRRVYGELPSPVPGQNHRGCSILPVATPSQLALGLSTDTPDIGSRMTSAQRTSPGGVRRNVIESRSAAPRRVSAVVAQEEERMFDSLVMEEQASVCPRGSSTASLSSTVPARDRVESIRHIGTELVAEPGKDLTPEAQNRSAQCAVSYDHDRCSSPRGSQMASGY
jgi:hypothetical protein